MLVVFGIIFGGNKIYKNYCILEKIVYNEIENET